MDIKIKVEDYLTQSEIGDIVREEVRGYVRNQLTKKTGCTTQENFERIFSNAAYHIVAEEVDAAFDGDIKKVIKENAIKVINELSGITVFRKADVWEKEDSKSYKYLQEVLESQKSTIYDVVKKRVIESCDELAASSIKEAINDAIYDVVENNLFKKDRS